jgi:hypothetical protein
MAGDGKRANLQTFHALQASDLAKAMNEAFQKVRVQPGDYRPELTEPDGPSTGGGVQAMQHLRLVAGEQGLPTLVIGHANHAEGKAELRTYEFVDAIHRERFGRPLVLDRPAYDAFIGFAQQVFGALRLQTTIVSPPEPVVPIAPVAMSTIRRPTQKAMTLAVVVAVGMALAIGVIVMYGRG